MSDDWTILQENLAAAFAGFLEVCDQLDSRLYENTTIDGQWSAKDVVAHLTGWDHEATERFWRFLAGPTEDITYNADEFNSRSVAARQHFSYGQALKELKTVHRGLEEAIAAVQPEDLENESRFVEWMEALSTHYAEHTMQLRRLIG